MPINLTKRITGELDEMYGHLAVSYTHLDVYKRQTYTCVHNYLGIKQ